MWTYGKTATKVNESILTPRASIPFSVASNPLSLPLRRKECHTSCFQIACSRQSRGAPKSCLGIWDGGVEPEGWAAPSVRALGVPGLAAPPPPPPLLLEHPGRPGRAGMAILQHCYYSVLPSKPTPGPTSTPQEGQTLPEKWFPTPLQRDRCRGQKGPLGLWKLYKVYSLGRARSRKGLRDGGGCLEMQKARKGRLTFVWRRQIKYPKDTRCGVGLGERWPFWNSCWECRSGRSLSIFTAFLGGRHRYPHPAEGRLRQRYFESSDLDQGQLMV